jgi:hypothetical protein
MPKLERRYSVWSDAAGIAIYSEYLRISYRISSCEGTALYPSCFPTAMSSEKRTKAVDLSHHVSDYARRYAPSPLKGLQKHHGTKIVLSGGELSDLPPEQY